MSTSNFSKIAAKVLKAVSSRVADSDRDADWQRVNSYIADVLKDSHVLYAKLARLQGDFGGEELARLMKISEAVLTIGDELSNFSKAFYEGKYSMLQSEFTYGENGGAPSPNPKAEGGAPPPSPMSAPDAPPTPPAPETPPSAPEAPAPVPEAPLVPPAEPLTQDYDVPVEEAGAAEGDDDYSADEEEPAKKPAKKDDKPKKKE